MHVVAEQVVVGAVVVNCVIVVNRVVDDGVVNGVVDEFDHATAVVGGERRGQRTTGCRRGGAGGEQGDGHHRGGAAGEREGDMEVLLGVSMETAVTCTWNALTAAARPASSSSVPGPPAARSKSAT